MDTAAIRPGFAGTSVAAVSDQPAEQLDVSPAIELGGSDGIPGLYAKRDIAAGEIIARVSKCMLVTSEVAAASPPVRRLLERGVPLAAEICLAVFFLGARSGACAWSQLVAGIWHGPAPHAMFLSPEELDMLRGSYVMAALRECRAQFTAEHARLSSLLTDDEAGTLDDYLRARCMVMMHAQAIATARGEFLAMLPAPAMFSHGTDACAQWQWDGASQELVLRMRHAVGKDMRLPLSNSGWGRIEGLASLGALLEARANRRTDLVLPESATGWPDGDSSTLFGSRMGGKRVFRISEDCNDDAALQLLAYLRVSSYLMVTGAAGRAKAEEAVKEYVAGRRISPLCRDSEILAMQTLRAACRRQLDGFGTTVQDDEELLRRDARNAPGPIHRGIVSLRLQEKRILASFMEIADAALPLLQKYRKDSGIPFSAYLKAAAIGKDGAEQKIFVSIASYRDPLLWNTLKECLSNAERPDLLRFGIVDQNDEDAGNDLARLPFAQQVRYVNVKPRYSRGACWARSIAFGLYDDEDYLLQIDSHMIFDRGWDRILKSQFEELSANNPKCILSCYPWAFEIENDEAVRKVSSPCTLALRPMPNSSLTEVSPVLKFQPLPQSMSAHYYAYSLAAGFIFTLGTFVEEIPYDPHLYFHGEEQNLTIRAYTHGWDMYHPRVIPLYHLYKEPERTEGDAPRHWDEKDNETRPTPWWKLEEASTRRMCQLLYANGVKGAYGLGDVRSLEDFAMYSGIDYRHRKLTLRDQIPVQQPRV